MQIFTNIASQFIPLYGDMTPATKAERQRAHTEKQRIVEQSAATIAKLRGTAPQRVAAPVASVSRPTSRAAEQARLHKELIQAQADRARYHAEKKARMDAAALGYERNPGKIRNEREAESRRLAALEREIKAEQRTATWLTHSN